MKIGVTVPQAASSEGVAPRYVDIRAAALRVEQEGFDSIWVMDHLLVAWEGQPITGVWEGLTILAALAEATERIELGTLVVCTAFRNPGLLAKMADAIDEISDGRLILGLGAGWHEPEFTAFGLPFDHLASRFEDALGIIVPLLRTGAVDYTGMHERAPDCVSLPRGPRASGPPILIGASGPRLLRQTAEVADAWNTCWLGRASELAEKVAPMHAACDETGRDPATLDITVGQIVTIAGVPNDDDAPGDLAKYTYADAEDLAAEWRAFRDQGVAHMIVWPMPERDEVVELIAAALTIYREQGDA